MSTKALNWLPMSSDGRVWQVAFTCGPTYPTYTMIVAIKLRQSNDVWDVYAVLDKGVYGPCKWTHKPTINEVMQHDFIQ